MEQPGQPGAYCRAVHGAVMVPTLRVAVPLCAVKPCMDVLLHTPVCLFITQSSTRGSS